MRCDVRRLSIAAVIVASSAGCGGRSARVAPSAFHTEVTDPAGDARADRVVPHPPDLVAAAVDRVGTTVSFAIRFAAGTFDRRTTRVTIELDVDQSLATGIQTAYGLGIDYIVDLWAPAARAVVQQARPSPPGSPTACSPCYVNVAAVRLAVHDDEMTVGVPLSRLGNPRGPMLFRVLAYSMRPGLPPSGATVVTDMMPDAAAPPARVP